MIEQTAVMQFQPRIGYFLLVLLAALTVVLLGADASSPNDPMMVMRGGRFYTTITINGQNGSVIRGIHVSTTSGPCIHVTGASTNITIKESYIGPCGSGGNTTQSAGILIDGGSSVEVDDDYIHVENLASSCSPASHDGIEILNNGSGVVNIKGSVLAFNQSQVLAYNSSNVTVDGNFSLNPRGPGCGPGGGGNHFQIYNDVSPATQHTSGKMINNYTVSRSGAGDKFDGDIEDGYSWGGNFSGITDTGNYDSSSNNNSGCGHTMDSGAFNWDIENDIGQNQNCSYQVTNGSGTVNNNKGLVLTGGVNAAGMVVSTNGIPGNVCGPVTVMNNVIAGVTLANGSKFDDGSCTPETQSGNTFDSACTDGVNCSAYAALFPLATTNPPPQVPPGPVNCVIRSPWSNNSSKPLCRK